MTSIRDMLNAHKWHTADIERIALVVVHRGAPNDQRTIEGDDIQEIGVKGVFIKADDFARVDWEDGLITEQPDTTFIPYHRVLEIHLGTDVVWRRER